MQWHLLGVGSILLYIMIMNPVADESDKVLGRPIYATLYASAPSPNRRWGFLAATSKIVCANTEFAHANQLPTVDQHQKSTGMARGACSRV